MKGIWEEQTLTGITLGEAYKRIDKDLGKDAYKEMRIGNAMFTDIKPPFVYEILSECFGPCGIGWGFDVHDIEYLGTRQYKAKSGRTVTEHGARCTATVWYAREDGSQVTWGPVPGSAKNEERGYAESGCVTNAIGKAFSFLGVQRHIYKNSEPVTQTEEEAEHDAEAEFARMATLAKDNSTGDAVMAALGVAKKADAKAAFVAADEATRQEVWAAANGLEKP